jgi:hypothetical protein
VYQLDDYAYGDLTVTAVLTFNTQMRYGWDTGLSSVRLIAQKEDAQALQDAFEQEMEAQAAYQIESDHYGKGDWQTVPEDTYEAISFVLPGSYSDLAENPTYYQNGSPLSEAAYHEAYVVDGVVQDETVIDNYVVSDQPYVTYTGGYAAYLIHAKECPQDLQDRILGRGVV